MRLRDLATSAGIAVLIACLAGPAQAELVGYWSFEGDLTDSSGNGNDNAAGFGGDITFETDTPFGSGLSAQNYSTGTGAANVISVPTSASLEAINDQLTLSFWMKAAPGADWARLFQHGTEANPSRSWMVNRNSSNLYTNVRVDTIDDPGPPFVDGNWNQNTASGGASTYDSTWHHLVYVLDNGTWQKYVDGVASSGTYLHGDGLSNTRYLNIFGRNNGRNYVGQLDEVGIWDQVIPLASIQGLYDGTTNPYDAALPEPSTVAMLIGLIGMGLFGYLRRRRRAA